MKSVFIVMALTVIVACNKETLTVSKWYSEWQVSIGTTNFYEHCARCHGMTGEGVEKGKYQGPALNRLSDNMLESVPVLLEYILTGDRSTGRKVHDFKGKLSESEKLALLAFIQSLWPDKDYSEWLDWGGLN